jgi:hypothetical protein
VVIVAMTAGWEQWIEELLGIKVDPSVRVNTGAGRRLRCTHVQREALRTVYAEDVELWETVVLSGGVWG